MPLSTSQYGFIIDPMVPFTDASGTTIRNGYVRVFVAGSSTPVITYKNYDGATNEETIQLDNSGRTAYPVIVSKGNTYKVCVYDAEHSQESPILTIDKVVPAGANVEATNIVTGLDNVESPEAGWVKSTVSGTDAEVSLDATNVTSEVDTMVKATAASADYMMPLVHKTGSDPDKKITLGNIFKFVLNFIHSLTDTATEADLVAGNYFALDGSAGTKKLNSTTLLTKTAQNSLAGNVAPEFVPNETNAVTGMPYVYGGQLFIAKENYNGDWDESKFRKTDYVFGSKGVQDSLVLGIERLDAAKEVNSGWFASDVLASGSNLILFNFVAGRTYRVLLRLNNIPSPRPSGTALFAVTSNSKDVSDYVDYVTSSQGITYEDFENKLYEFVFTTTANATFLKIFSKELSGVTIFYKVEDCEKIVLNKQAFCLLKSFSIEKTAEEVSGASGTIRYYSDVELVAGRKYCVEISFLDFNVDFGQALDLFDINSNKNSSTADVVERLVTISKTTGHGKGDFICEFVPTKDANYIYIYSHCYASGGAYNVKVNLYEVGVEKREHFLMYGIGDSLMAYGYFIDLLRDKYGVDCISYAQGSTGYATNNDDPSKTTYPQRVPAMESSAPDIILVEGGTNDFAKNKTIAETKTGVENTIIALNTKYPGVPVVGVLPSQRYYWGSAQSPHGMINDLGINLIEYVDAIKEIYQKYGFPAIDLCREGGLNELNVRDLTIDGLHWTEGFSHHIGELIYPVIYENFRRR